MNEIKKQIDRLLQDHHDWQVEYETPEESIFGASAASMQRLLDVAVAAVSLREECTIDEKRPTLFDAALEDLDAALAKLNDNTEDNRIKIAEAIGWKRHESEEWWADPDSGMFKTSEFLPDPFTDANDDYACLEWMRNSEDRIQRTLYLAGLPTHTYQIGDYARALLAVIDGE